MVLDRTLNKEKRICGEQFGFMPGRCTTGVICTAMHG